MLLTPEVWDVVGLSAAKGCPIAIDVDDALVGAGL